MYSREMSLALTAAKAAGDFLKERLDVHVDSSEGKDIKLSSDRQSEKIIMDILEKSGIPVLSEECGKIGQDNDEELLWIIDPLDGTANYWKGIDDLCCVSIALWKGDSPILGVVNRFFRDEMYHGIVDEGAWINETPINTSHVDKISKAVLGTGFPIGYDQSEENLSKTIDDIRRFKKIRMLGTAAFSGASVAAGRMDAYIEDGIMIWDVAAAAAIVIGAGGVCDISLQENNKCHCRLFANRELLEDHDAESI